MRLVPAVAAPDDYGKLLAMLIYLSYLGICRGLAYCCPRIVAEAGAGCASDQTGSSLSRLTSEKCDQKAPVPTTVSCLQKNTGAAL